MAERISTKTDELEPLMSGGWWVYDERMEDPYALANLSLPTAENAVGLNSSESLDLIQLLKERRDS